MLNNYRGYGRLSMPLTHLRFLYFILLLVVANLGIAATDLPAPTQADQSIKTPYGDIRPSPIIGELLRSPALIRIQHIDQSGALYYFGYVPKYTRYEHSLGVFALLYRFKRPLAEQAAGLLHDTSHTVFSHTGDYLFKQVDKTHAYQDTIHLWFLEKMGIPKLVSDHNITLSDLDPDSGRNIALEQHLPDMCADRIEYNLHTGLLFKQITATEFHAILDNLHFENNRWFFTDARLAARFANLSLYFTQNLWGAPWNNAFNHYFAEMLTEAMNLKLLNTDHIHFGTDKAVLDILTKAESPYIQTRLKACSDIHAAFKLLPLDAETYDAYFTPKFRGIDPWIQTAQGFQRLTDLDSTFKEQYLAVKLWAQQGMKIQLNLAKKLDSHDGNDMVLVR
jgi:hypothetical protein